MGGIILDSTDNSDQLVVDAEDRTKASLGRGAMKMITEMKVEPGEENTLEKLRDSSMREGPVIVS